VRRHLAALVVLGLVLGCGKSKEEERRDLFRSTCEALAGAATLDEAARQFGSPFVDCTVPGLIPMPVGDHCVYAGQFICRSFWISFANDPGLCGPPPLGGCYYWCEARFAGSLNAPSIPPTTPICGARFVGEQGLPPL
jgi:hypothetical protein